MIEILRDAGVDLVVGLPGTQTLPLDHAVRRSDLDYLQTFHETAVPHVAWGHYEAGGTPVATLTVPGPGDTNAMHGLKNAYDDGVPIVHLSADIDPDDRGKGEIHEIRPDTYDNVVKENLTVADVDVLGAKLRAGIEAALTRPRGPVRLGIPKRVLKTNVDQPTPEVTPGAADPPDEDACERAARAIADADRPVVYVGNGARRSGAAAEVEELVDELNAPVVASYKGKGVFSEDDDRWLGVTGSHTPEGARKVLEAADVVVAVGTEFDAVTTDGCELPMGDVLVDVHASPRKVRAGYEPDVRVDGDERKAVARVRSELPGNAAGRDGADVGERVRMEYLDELGEQDHLGGAGPPTIPEVHRTLRKVLPEETVVVTDVGEFRLWAMQVFEAYGPDRYVTAGSWAGMGVGLPAAIGARMAREDDVPVACLTGDGGLLMYLQALHTAAERDLDLAVFVYNNRDFGSISGKSDALNFDWDSPSLAKVAEGLNSRGRQAKTLAEVEEDAEWALECEDPALVDIRINEDTTLAKDAADYTSTVRLP